MSKTVLHYKRRIESLAGPGASVQAWRSPFHQNAMRYQIDCLRCRLVEGSINVGWSSAASDFRTVMREWTLHEKLVHTNCRPPQYSVEVTADDTALATSYLKSYARRVIEGVDLNRIFGHVHLTL